MNWNKFVNKFASLPKNAKLGTGMRKFVSGFATFLIVAVVFNSMIKPASANPGQGDIDVPAGVTWTVANLVSTYPTLIWYESDGDYYNVSANILIWGNLTLSSITMKFHTDSGIIVYSGGYLNATDCTFTSYDNDFYWDGITFDGGDGRIDACEITYADYGVYCNSSSYYF